MRSRRSGRGFGTFCIVLVLVLLVAGIGWVSSGFRNWDTKTWFGKDAAVTPEVQGDVFTLGGEALESGKEYPLPDGVAFAMPTAASESAGEGIVLTATVLPETATNKHVTWSVAWVNDAAEWATGKTVTEYVTITPEENSILSARLACLQGFSEQVVVSVASVDNPEAMATCTVDYLKRVKKVDGYVAAASEPKDANIRPLYFDSSDHMHVNGYLNWSLAEGEKAYYRCDTLNVLHEEVGTITDTYKMAVKIRFDEHTAMVMGSLGSSGVHVNVADWQSNNIYHVDQFDADRAGWEAIFGANSIGYVDVLATVPSSYGGNCWELVVTLTGTYKNYEYVFALATQSATWKIPVSDVTINDSETIF